MMLKVIGLLLFVGLILTFTLDQAARVNAQPVRLPSAVVQLRSTVGLGTQQNSPTLQISTAVTASAGSVITVPLTYVSNGATVTSLAFSLDIDQACLAFAPANPNGNGLSDALTVHAPPGINVSATVNLLDEDGELDLIIADFFPPFVILPDRSPLLELRLQSTCPVAAGATRTAAVRFSTDPQPSLGTASGAPITATTIDGFVTISGPPLPATATPTPPLPATPTLIPTQPPATPPLLPTVPPMTIIRYFNAIAQYPFIRLQWQTVQEVETAGFSIYRRDVGRSAEFLLLAHLLPTQGVDHLYTFIDQHVQPDGRYLYLLVEEKANGVRTEFVDLITSGSLAGDQPYQLLLPLIVR